MSNLLHEVVAVIRKTERDILSGRSKLALITPVFTTDLVRLPMLAGAGRHRREGPPVLGKRAEDLKIDVYLSDLQYLADIADKVLALKIIHGDGTLQGTISLQPFRSLKYLELKKLPLHLLTGLANLRGQLEYIVCCRSLQDLDLLLRKCGGDGSQGFPWSQLKTLICIDCDMEDLDGSLEFTPSLQSLDLSRNALRDCGDAFLRLDDLTTINLSHNQIEKIPRFSSVQSRRLKILGLRNNRLESLEGTEDLENLQELDLSDNCISEHRLLWPLQRLARLVHLNLQGNPISHHAKHRILTIQHLNPRAVPNSRFQLDGVGLTRAETIAAPELPPVRSPVIRSASPLNMDVSSVSLDSANSELVQSFQDSMSTSGLSTSGRRRPVRVRTVKLVDQPDSSEAEVLVLPSEPFLDMLSSSQSSAFALDIEERRQRFGEEWLKFQAAHQPTSSVPIATGSHFPVESLKFDLADADEDRSRPTEHAALAREESADQPAEQTETDENESTPFLVQPHGDSDPNHTLLITLGDVHLIERNISGVVGEMLELTSILKAELLDGDDRTVAVYFDYLRKDRRRRHYVFENSEQAMEFLELVAPLLEKKDEKQPFYQCLQCSEIFPEYRAETKVKYVAKGDFQHSGYSSSVGSASTKGVLAETAMCPFCSSEMLVQHKSGSSSASVTPEEESSPSPSSPITGSQQTASAEPTRQRSSSVVILNSEPSYQDETILPASFRSPFREAFSPTMASPSPQDDSAVFERQDSSEETLFAVESVESALQILRAKAARAPSSGELEWHFDDFSVVDHRLRLYTDMNILTDAGEKFAMLARVAVVGTKSNLVQDTVLVVSSLRIYVNRMNGQKTGDDPSLWLHGHESAFLSDVNLLDQICEKECLRLGFADGSFWIILFRDRTRCALFSRQLEDILTSKKVSFLVRDTNDVADLETWLSETAFTGDDTEPTFPITLRTMCLLGKAPVTLLCTESHVVLVKDDYASLLRTGKSAVSLIDAKPVSAVNCLVAYQETPTNISLKFFDEDPDCINQWDFHFETVDGLQLLVEAVHEPWMRIFHVALNVELHPVQS